MSWSSEEQGLKQMSLKLSIYIMFYMCFTPDARGTEYSNSVPAGTEFQNDHECEARGIHFSLGPSA